MIKEKKEMFMLVALGFTLFITAIVLLPFVTFPRQETNILVQQNGSITVTGEMVCLPHKDLSGPQTDECAIGLKTDQQEYFALDFSSASMNTKSLVKGEKVTVSGIFVPIDQISSNHWEVYPIKGILSVTEFSR